MGEIIEFLPLIFREINFWPIQEAQKLSIFKFKGADFWFMVNFTFEILYKLLVRKMWNSLLAKRAVFYIFCLDILDFT